MAKKDTNFFVTNEDLREHIHKIHNFMRNNGFGYGKRALEIFSVFYGLKLIENKLNNLNLDKGEIQILSFNNLLKYSENRNNKNLFNTPNPVTEKIDEILDCIQDSKNLMNDLKKYILYDVPTKKQGITEKTWCLLIKMINDVPAGYENGRVNLSGKVYEYFIGRDQTAISELGAYFTDRHITNFIFEELIKPSLNKKNELEKMIDPFGGSGGFTLGYVNYIIEKYKKTISEDNNFWKNNINKIYHYDMESSVVNMTGLELLAITGEISSNTNLQANNSFTSEFNNLKYKFVISNPPYGGDKVNKNAEQIKRDKLMNYIKNISEDERTEELKNQLKELIKETNNYKKQSQSQSVNLVNCSKRIKNIAKSSGIENEKAKDKEACSLLLLMDLLEDGGTCCAVLKEGVFFDSKYSTLRGSLINNFNITDIVSVPQSAFENTSTKTSIIKFIAGSPTKKIVFTELVVENEENDVYEIKEDGKVHLTKNKGEIKNTISKVLCSATYKQLTTPTITKNKKGEEVMKFEYSLNYKNYKTDKVFCPEGFELKKLGDVSEIRYGERITKINNVVGEIPVYGGGDVTFYTNTHNRDGFNIVISRFGISKTCVRLLNKKIFLNDSALSIHNKNNQINEYLGYYLYYNQNLIYKCANSTAQKNLDIDLFKNIQIPIPKDITTLKKELNKLQKLHQAISINTELIPEKEKYICELIKKLTDEGSEGVDYDSKKFNQLVEYQAKNKKYKASAGKTTGKYKFYTSSQDKILFINDDPMFREKMLIMGRKGDVSVHYDYNFSCEHDDVYVMKVINFSERYLYYYIKNNLLWFYERMNGSTIKGTSKEILGKFTVKILKPSIMTKYKLQELFDEVDKLKDTLEGDKQEYQIELKALFKDFDNEDNNKLEDKNNAVNDNESDDLEELEAGLENKKRPKNNIIIDDSKSSNSSSSNKSLKQIIYKIDGISCIKENNEYYIYENKTKGDLFATQNKKGDIELVGKSKYEYLTINETEYILIDNKVYTILNDEPDELYGNYINDKFTKIKKNSKVIVKKNKTDNLEL